METKKFKLENGNFEALMLIFDLNFDHLKEQTKNKYFFDCNLLSILFLQNWDHDILKSKLHELLQTAQIDLVNDGSAIFELVQEKWGEEKAYNFFLAAKRYDILVFSGQDRKLLRSIPSLSEYVIKLNLQYQRLNEAAYQSGNIQKLIALEDWYTLAYFDKADILLKKKLYDHMFTYPCPKCWSGLIRSGNAEVILNKLKHLATLNQLFRKTKALSHYRTWNREEKNIFLASEHKGITCYELIRHLLDNQLTEIFINGDDWKILDDYRYCWGGCLRDLITSTLIDLQITKEKNLEIDPAFWSFILKNIPKDLCEYLIKHYENTPNLVYIYQQAEKYSCHQFITLYKAHKLSQKNAV